MWWHPIFRCRRYKWLLDQVNNVKKKTVKQMDKLDLIYCKVIDSWDPRGSMELGYLYEAIASRNESKPIFTLDLICKCILDLDEFDFIEYYTAWSIIHLMLTRMVKESDYYDTELYIRTKTMLCKNMERLVTELPQITISTSFSSDEKIRESEINQVVLQLKIKISKKHTCNLHNVLFFMAEAFAKIHTLENEILPMTMRLQLHLQLLVYNNMDNPFSGITNTQYVSWNVVFNENCVEHADGKFYIDFHV